MWSLRTWSVFDGGYVSPNLGKNGECVSPGSDKCISIIVGISRGGGCRDIQRRGMQGYPEEGQGYPEEGDAGISRGGGSRDIQRRGMQGYPEEGEAGISRGGGCRDIQRRGMQGLVLLSDFNQLTPEYCLFI